MLMRPQQRDGPTLTLMGRRQYRTDTDGDKSQTDTVVSAQTCRTTGPLLLFA